MNSLEHGAPFNPFGLFRGIFIPNSIAMSDISDRAKLLLGRLFQYAGENGKAYPSRESLKSDLGWKIRKLDHAIKDLKEYGLIETYQEDEQSPSHYVFLYSPLYENDNTGAVKDDSRGTVKDDKQKRKKEEREKGTKVPKQDSKESCSEKEIKKGTNGKRIIRTRSNSSLVREKAKQVVPKKAVPKTLYLSENYKACLDYWNSKPCLSKTLVNQDKPTKQLEKTKKALSLFFKGTLFTSAGTVMPKGFSDTNLAELKSYTAVDDLLEMIDVWEEVLTSGKYKINTEYFAGLSFLDFLQGNPHVRNGDNGLVAPIVSHVFFEPKTKTEDKFPKSTAAIAKRWQIIIGKPKKNYKEEFAKISNLVNESYKEGNWKWKWNAMSACPNPAAAVIKILADNKDYMKKQKMNPDIVNKPWFRRELEKLTKVKM